MFPESTFSGNILLSSACTHYCAVVSKSDLLDMDLHYDVCVDCSLHVQLFISLTVL